ncbi:MAG: hypothetical protein ACO1OD_05225 [Croceibacterium sp.]
MVHAVSESDPLRLGQILRLDGSISASAYAEALSLQYRLELVARQAEALEAAGEQPSDQMAVASAQATSAQLPAASLSAKMRSRAEHAFQLDPLEATTLRIIALGAILPRDEERGRAALEVAFGLNKRDIFTSMWLADFALRSGDIDGAMEKFDAALRTSGTARRLVMKPLVNLLQSPAADEPLAALLRDNPDWEEDFWREYMQNPVALRNSVRFLSTPGVGFERLDPAQQALLLRQLRNRQAYDDVIALGQLDAASEASFFGPDTASEPDPLGWRLNSQGGFASYWVPQSGKMQLSAQPGTFGTVAERIVRIDGRKDLYVALESSVPPDMEISARILCADDSSRELAILRLRPGETEGSAVVGAGPDCRYGRLELRFDNQANRRSALLEIAKVSLE